MSEILKGSYSEEDKDDHRKPRMQYNSIDFVANVQRLPVSGSQATGIYTYGNGNDYPSKVTEIAKRSSSLDTVIEKQAQFIAGLGFEGATAKDVINGTAVIINEKGETLYDLLKFCALEKSNINIAIHVNFNQLGEAVEFNLIQYDLCRKKIKLEDEKYNKYIISNIFHLENDYTNGYYSNYGVIQNFNNWMKEKEKNPNFPALEVYDYNPDPIVVREQIELSGGIENYSGQLFYRNRSQDIYQRAIYDSVLDDAQFDAESKLFSLSSIQNGFSSGGFLKYFATADSSKELKDLNSKINNTKGSINANRIITVPVAMNVDAKMPVMFEAATLPNHDKLHENTKKESKANINQRFSVPNVLIGKDSEGNFATQRIQEAFDFYNSVTETYRQELEIELTTLITNSVFANQVKLPIEIKPLIYKSSIKKEESEKISENEQTTN